ncbi:MAG TPA: hypothetical protein VGH09_08405 [Solirubrobacteraceae bacterium]|jgi:hypothetical protein
MRHALAILACAALVSLAGAAATAQADVFGPTSLASAGVVPGGAFVQQAESANDAAVSGNGRYVAFDGSFAGRRGVFRRDLATGEVATVAEGDAMLPSISADGRYVSFTTTAQLDAEDDTNGAPDVYVRDMAKPSPHPCPEGWRASEQETEECAFTLASAVNGSSVGLAYAPGPSGLGSVAAGRSALSADGNEVAFETTAVSNLANPPGVVEPATAAPQIAVRYLDSDTTRLVTVRYDQATGSSQLYSDGRPEPTPTSAEGRFGAVYPSGENIPPFPSPAFPAPPVGASLSADGSTVAWMAQQIAEQAPVMRGADLADHPDYTEPLWRRIGEGQSAPTRRVTGGSDPTSVRCEQSGETQLSSPATLADPCQGPFETEGGREGSATGLWTGGTSFDYLPRLSANGMIVALLANAREIASGEELSAAQRSDDLYVVNMSDGLTREAATRRLTEIAGASSGNGTSPIVDLGVSPGGDQIALSSERSFFPLGSPTYVSPPAGAAGAVELYDVDLEDDTLTRVTQGFEGGPSEGPVGSGHEPSFTGSPSFTTDGNLLAFSSNSTNLVYGDGNKNSDAFVVDRRVFTSESPVSEISGAPVSPALAPAWQLQATALSRRDGTVLLEVLVPGAGTLRAGARGAVRVATSVRSASVGAGRKRRASHAGRARVTVQTRTVASALKRPGEASLFPVTLKLARAYSALASARGGFSANVALSFSATGHPVLHDTLAVSFVRAAHKTHARHSRRPKRRGRR